MYTYGDGRPLELHKHQLQDVVYNVRQAAFMPRLLLNVKEDVLKCLLLITTDIHTHTHVIATFLIHLLLESRMEK